MLFELCCRTLSMQKFVFLRQQKNTMRSVSPFPGMDPYLEGHLWPDVHNRLANVIAEWIAPRIAPKYVARIEPYTAEDKNPESEIGITYPDVAVLHQHRVEESAVVYGDAPVLTEPDVYVAGKITVRIPVVEIRDVAKNRLITVIEILSPVNKRGAGREAYLHKRDRLHESGVHLLELDLLRRGERTVRDKNLLDAHYLFCLWRAGSERVAVWKNRVSQALPVLPVPLKKPDADVLLPLKEALDMVYQRGLYHLSIDYKTPPPPPDFQAEELAWMNRLSAEG